MAKKRQKKAKLNYRGIIVILVIIAIIVAIVITVTRKNTKNEEQPQQQVETYRVEDDGTKYNTSTKLQETKTFEGYEISNIGLKEVEGEVEFSAKIKNVTTKTIGKETLYIVFKTQSGEELYKMEVYSSEIKPDKSININSKITKAVVEAYDIELRKK